MELKKLNSEDLEELSDSVYEHLSKVFILLSSVLSAVVVGWFAYLILYKCWVYFGILQPSADGLSLGVLIAIPIFYSIYNSKLTESGVSPKVQFKTILVQLFWVFLALTIVFNLDLLVVSFRSFYDFLLSEFTQLI